MKLNVIKKFQQRKLNLMPVPTIHNNIINKLLYK